MENWQPDAPSAGRCATCRVEPVRNRNLVLPLDGIGMELRFFLPVVAPARGPS